MENEPSVSLHNKSLIFLITLRLEDVGDKLLHKTILDPPCSSTLEHCVLWKRCESWEIEIYKRPVPEVERVLVSTVNSCSSADPFISVLTIQPLTASRLMVYERKRKG